MRDLLLVLLVLALCVSTAHGYQVCYHPFNCFDIDVPTDYTPEAPEDLDLEFHLYTRKNTENADVVKYADDIALNGTNFDPALPVKVVIHGYLASAQSGWMQDMKHELLKKGNFNVLLTDWRQGAGINYFQSVANVPSVGSALKHVLAEMSTSGVNWEDIHLIGHSLGAHISGLVGLLSGSRIGRISGLDPALTGFSDRSKDFALDKSDAMFVDVIHTNMEGASSGHVDFYADGGKTQNGCEGNLPGCSHQRSHDLYIESINSKCQFMAFPCGSNADFLDGKCLTCGQLGCGILGYHADQVKARGARFLDTHEKFPYCGYEYKVTITPHPSLWGTKGYLSISAKEGKAQTPFASLTKSATSLTDSPITRGALFDRNIDNATTIEVTFEKVGFFSSSTYRTASIEITNAITGQTFKTCAAGAHSLHSGYPTSFRIDRGHCRDIKIPTYILG